MVGTIQQFNDRRLELIAQQDPDPDERQAAKKELQQRRRNRREFVRGFDDEELEEIMYFPSWKMGPYDTRALEAGVDVDGPTLEALAREEIDRRERYMTPD